MRKVSFRGILKQKGVSDMYMVERRQQNWKQRVEAIE